MDRKTDFVAVEVDALEWNKVRPHADRLQHIRYRTVLEGGEGLPQVHETEYSPGWVEPRHRHPDDEVLILVEGELEIEGTVHRAPTVLFVGRGRLYGPLTAGGEGARFFRVASRRLEAEPAANEHGNGKRHLM